MVLPLVHAACPYANQKLYYADGGNVYELKGGSTTFEHLGLIGGGYESMNLKSESLIVVPRSCRQPSVFLMGGYTVSVVVNKDGKAGLRHNPQPLNFEVMVRPRILIDGKRFLKAWPRALMPNPKYGFGYCLVKDVIFVAGGSLTPYTQTDTCSLYYHNKDIWFSAPDLV
jgi:hypothetical protein